MKVATNITLSAFILLSMTTKAQTKISFEVSFPEPQTHYAEVKMAVSTNKDSVDIKMPVWAPGSYLIREFAKNVEGFSAKSEEGKVLSAQKIDKNTWRIHTNRSGKIEI